MAKKQLTQSQKQHQQLKLVFDAVAGSIFGSYLDFGKISKKKTATLEEAHLALVDATEVLTHSAFLELLRGLVPQDNPKDDPEIFLTPNLMTTEEIGGICTLEESTTKSLPLTKKQISFMRAHRQAYRDELAQKHNVKDKNTALYFYNNPQVNVLSAARIWHTGIDSILSRSAKKLFGSAPEPQPELSLFNKEEKRLKNYIRLFAKGVEKESGTEIIYAQPYHFSDVGQYLRISHKRNIRLAELAPELKIVMLDVTAYSTHRIGVVHFLQSHSANIYMHLYRPEGVYGHGIAPDKAPTVIKPVLDGGVFYEFIPLKNFKPVKGELMSTHQRLSLEAVKEGEKYVLVVSSIAGVIGFNTRTIVRITQKDPLLFEVIGQIGALDHQGQMLTGEQTDKIVVHLNKTIVKPYQFYIRHYMVGDHRDQEQLVWALELSRPPKTASIQVLRGIANSLHASLAKENSNYRRTYEQPSIPAPIFTFLPPGTFLEANMSGAKRMDFAEDSYNIKYLIKQAGDRLVKIRAARIGASD